MKPIKGLPLLFCLLLVMTVILVACDSKTPADTAGPDTTASTEAPTDALTEAPTEATTDAPEETTAETPDASETTSPEDQTEEETTTFVPPVADPEDAAAAGLPLDGNNYTVGGESPAQDPAAQYEYLSGYANCYVGKSFTLYGNLIETTNEFLVLSLGENMEIPVYFEKGNAPTVGSYVKLTATYTQTVDKGDYVDFTCYTMMVSAAEVLGEAKGPNGGKLMYITASSLNVRTSSDTSSGDNIIGTYSKGDLVEVFEQDANGWYRVNYNGQKAYISYKYVSETKP